MGPPDRAEDPCRRPAPEWHPLGGDAIFTADAYCASGSAIWRAGQRCRILIWNCKGKRVVPVEKQAYREAMARLGAAVNVITTDGPAGRAGFTASAVTSVTDTPPTLLVCANRTNDSYPAMKQNGVLCVNTLTPAQEGLSPVFAGMTQHTMNERFDGYAWHTLQTGAPVLDQAVVVFDCRITQIVEVGTHDVFFCSVEAVRTGPAHEGLIYYGRGYHRVSVG